MERKPPHAQNIKKLKKKENEAAVGPHVYRKGPPYGVGGSCRGEVCHAEVGWVLQGCGGSYSGGVGHAGVQWVIQG